MKASLVLLVVLVVLLVTSCARKADDDDANTSTSQDNHFKITTVVYSGSGPKMYLITDLHQEREYLSVSGVGVIELRKNSTTFSSN